MRRDILVADLNQHKNISDQLRKERDALNAELAQLAITLVTSSGMNVTCL